MKKILFLLIAIIISGNITAQKLDWQERRKAADEIDVLIEKYINTCDLSDLGKSEYSTEQAEAFKALFEANAKITDRLSSQAAEDGGTEVSEQSVEAYTQALMARFPQGITVKIAKLQADYSQLDQRKARVAIERQFSARDETGKYVLDTADVMLYLTIDRELEFVKINKFTTGPITKVASTSKKICVNSQKKIKHSPGESVKLFFPSIDAAKAALWEWEDGLSLKNWGLTLVVDGECPAIWLESFIPKNKITLKIGGEKIKIRIK